VVEQPNFSDDVADAVEGVKEAKDEEVALQLFFLLG
jgi:hypothetical protein